jgi:uncharacterized protein (TIGR03067 family)
MEGLELFQGEWSMISMEIKGVKVSNEKVKNCKLTVTGDKWVVKKNGRIYANSMMRIDHSMEPKAIDLVQDSGNAELIYPGIYKIEGNTLTICRTSGYKERPKEFKTTLDAAILIVWKRSTVKPG